MYRPLNRIHKYGFTILFLAVLVFPNQSNAQFSFKKSKSKLEFTPEHEFGILVAANQQRSDINNLYVVDMSSVGPGVGLFYRYTFNYYLAAGATVTYYQLHGADSHVRDKELYSNGWFRYIRNLSFRTDVMEAAAHLDVHALKFQPFSIDGHRWTPYVSGGVGLIYFNPKAELDGKYYSLQPLGTEGQGTAGHNAKYSRTTWAAPIRVGVKVNLTDFASLQYFVGYTYIGTDYLDDIHSTYTDPSTLSPLAAKLAMRAGEVAYPEVYGRITAPGEQRGDPTGKDGYFVTGLTMSFRLAKKPPCIPCPKWGRK